jgi:SAM-dependent methyltransferase
MSAALEMPVELLTHLPDLLQDLASMGCTLEPTLRLARMAGVGPSHLVLDLCCGKGAASLALASEFGCRVVGVDLFPPFIHEARALAEEGRMGHLCTFLVADARGYLGSDPQECSGGGASLAPPPAGEGTGHGAASGVPESFDGVVLAAAGSALGGYGETVKRLRRVVRPGGWILLEDGYLPEGFAGILPPGHEHCLRRDEALKALTSHGDRLVEEVVVPRSSVAAFNRTTTRLIRRRAEEVAAREPRVAEGVRAYAREQEHWGEAALAVERVIWLLRRGP